MLDGIALGLAAFLIDETYYPRQSGATEMISRKSKIRRVLGLEQRQSGLVSNTVWEAMSGLKTSLMDIPVLLATFYYFLTWSFSIGINVTFAAFIVPVFNFGPPQIGKYRTKLKTITLLTIEIAAMYCSPVIGTLLAEAIGHWLHDYIGRVYTRRHDGRLEAEARLIAIYPATAAMIAGLVLMGYTLKRQYHYMIFALSWFLHSFGVMLSTTAINAFMLDAYPDRPGEVAALINFGRTSGGFVISYVQLNWALATGTQVQYGTQAGIVAGAFLIILFLQAFGRRLRQWNSAKME